MDTVFPPGYIRYINRENTYKDAYPPMGAWSIPCNKHYIIVEAVNTEGFYMNSKITKGQRGLTS